MEKSDSDLIKEGNKAAYKGNWERAVTLWNEAKSSDIKEDEIATTYNLAIYDEVQGRLEQALQKFEAVYGSSGDAKYTIDIASNRTSNSRRMLRESTRSRETIIPNSKKLTGG